MRILSIGKIAEYHGVSKSTIYRWLKAGKITENYRTYGNHRRFIVENNQDKIILYSSFLRLEINHPLSFRS